MRPLKCYICKAERPTLTSIKNPDMSDECRSVAACETCLKKHEGK